MRERDVDGLFDQHSFVALGLELGLPRLQRSTYGLPGLPHPLARLGLGLRRERADLAVGERERAPVAGVREPGLLQRLEVASGRERRQRRVARPRHLIGMERRDLDRVEAAVGSGHDDAV